jgi:hypothetical protein
MKALGIVLAALTSLADLNGIWQALPGGRKVFLSGSAPP